MKKGHKLPKRLLGMEIPKPLRDLGWLHSFLESEIGRRILAEALVAAAAAASAALIGAETEAGAEASGEKAKPERKSGSAVKDALRSAAGAMTEVVGNAAKSMLVESLPENRGKRPTKTQ